MPPHALYLKAMGHVGRNRTLLLQTVGEGEEIEGDFFLYTRNFEII